MKRLNRTLWSFGWLLLLAACGSVPPAPTDHFYRLQAVSVSSPTAKLSGAVAVNAFSADSLYAERPIIYAEEARARQLRQYHYHLWLYPPGQLVSEHFRDSMGKSLEIVSDAHAQNAIDGRIVSFERVLDGRNSKAVVALELSVKVAGKTQSTKTYKADQPAADDSLDAFAVAMEQALAKIYAEFLADAAVGH